MWKFPHSFMNPFVPGPCTGLDSVQCEYATSSPTHCIYVKVHLASYYSKFCTSHKCIIQGVGTVVSGTTLKGVIRINDTLLLGPDSLGQFQPIAVKSIHRKRMPVREVRGGQTASFALKKVCIFCHNLTFLAKKCYLLFAIISKLFFRYIYTKWLLKPRHFLMGSKYLHWLVTMIEDIFAPTFSFAQYKCIHPEQWKHSLKANETLVYLGTFKQSFKTNPILYAARHIFREGWLLSVMSNFTTIEY